jgi:hypothetical protein
MSTWEGLLRRTAAEIRAMRGCQKDTKEHGSRMGGLERFNRAVHIARRNSEFERLFHNDQTTHMSIQRPTCISSRVTCGIVEGKQAVCKAP